MRQEAPLRQRQGMLTTWWVLAESLPLPLLLWSKQERPPGPPRSGSAVYATGLRPFASNKRLSARARSCTVESRFSRAIAASSRWAASVMREENGTLVASSSSSSASDGTGGGIARRLGGPFGISLSCFIAEGHSLRDLKKACNFTCALACMHEGP